MRRNSITVIVTTVILAIICTGNAFAQRTATASVGATIVEPIALSKNVDMNFGNAAVSVSAGGFVTLSPTGARSSSGSGVTLPATTGTVSAAGFTVSGAPGFTYTITLPPSAVISGPGSSTMLVNSFTSQPSAIGTLNSSGTQTLTVGATLYVAPGQNGGVYTNATALPVTVNYN